MPLLTSCDHCGVKLKTRDDYVGRNLTCPKCQQRFVAKPLSASVEPRPAQPAVARPADETCCPKCGATLRTEAVLCVDCGYHLKLRRKIQVSHETHETDDKSESSGYLGTLVDASPGSGELIENSGMEIDLSSLTFPGWCLTIVTLLVAGGAVLAPFLMLTSSGNRTSGGLARAVGIPIALIAGGATFWLGKRILLVFKIPIIRDE
jgi:DNA-directed RNA polymerase subunit M/transcription elongation factor TFIIS